MTFYGRSSRCTAALVTVLAGLIGGGATTLHALTAASAFAFADSLQVFKEL
jgi:hypothetical protein